MSSDTVGLDYEDAEMFESAINDGTKVKDKIVQFHVIKYAPDSALGINCHAGEHLNFIFENELEVKKGDTIVVRITEEPSKLFLLGSWKIPCEFLEISETEEIESDAENESSSDFDEENRENEPTEISLTMSADDFEGMNYKTAEKKFREMGFTEFEYETVDTDEKSLENEICYIEITEFIFGDSDFEKGDEFDSDSTVTFHYYKYKEPTKPLPESYSTNDYETAKKGNTGVYSYKNLGGTYDIYWIIDFDEGYVYNFTDGNDNDICDKLKIEDGDLNSRITINWSYGEDPWYLYFKYKELPVTLVVCDHNGVEMEFTTTNLGNALDVRESKQILEY